MIKRLLLAWGLLGVLTGWTKLDRDPHNLQPIINAMQFDGVETTVSWEDCGQINAYYWPLKKHVYLCNELEGLPDGLIQFILAHELAHGVIYQRQIPITGSKEAAADELAAYIMHAMGRDREMLEAATWYAVMNTPEFPPDDHPSDIRRAWALMRLADGTSEYSRRVTWTWNYLLELP